MPSLIDREILSVRSRFIATSRAIENALLPWFESWCMACPRCQRVALRLFNLQDKQDVSGPKVIGEIDGEIVGTEFLGVRFFADQPLVPVAEFKCEGGRSPLRVSTSQGWTIDYAKQYVACGLSLYRVDVPEAYRDGLRVAIKGGP